MQDSVPAQADDAGEREFHPYANLFPMISGRALVELEDDIRAHGLREEIVTFEGRIADGRNRYRACRKVGVTPIFREYEGDNLLAFVLSANLHRRHLSESQRATIAAEIANLPAHRPTADKSANLRTSQEAAAKMLNVSIRSVQSAAAVRVGAVPEIQEAVKQGHVAVSTAAQLAVQSPDRQRSIIADLPRDAEGRLTREVRTVLAPVMRELRAEQIAEKKLHRANRESALGVKQLALPDKRYGCILADPEWQLDIGADSGLLRHPENHYSTSPTSVIAARPVGDIAADDCVLFLWATVPMLPDALEVMTSWGFAYRSNFAWYKPKAGTGYWNRNRHELLLVGTRGKIPAPAFGTQWHSVIEAPTGRHSEKPDAAYQLIEEYFPTLPKIELNARKARPGWARWGLEAPPEDGESGDQ